MKVRGGKAVAPQGEAYGPGLYFAHKSDASLGYSDLRENRYRESQLGRKICIMAVCDVARLPAHGVSVEWKVGGKVISVSGKLNEYDTSHLGRISVLTAPEAAVVRALLVVEEGSAGYGQLRNGVEGRTLRDDLKKLWKEVGEK